MRKSVKPHPAFYHFFFGRADHPRGQHPARFSASLLHLSILSSPPLAPPHLQGQAAAKKECDPTTGARIRLS
jgi:hypothetical protein